LTSGILLMSKKPELVKKFHEELEAKSETTKTYLAKVVGDFQVKNQSEITVNKPIYCVSKKDNKHDVCEDSEIE